MYYLCTRNSKERVFGGVWRALSGEQVLTIRELLVSYFVEVSGPNGHYIIIGTLANAIEVLLYIIGVSADAILVLLYIMGTPIYNRYQT